MNRELNIIRYIYTENDRYADNLLELRSLMLDMVPTDYHEKCKACPIHEECYGPVPGAGDVAADIVFIGRNPGQTEDKQGLPFVGRGGELLDRFIGWAELDRRNIYITNLVKCFTTDNRPPKPDEIKTCVSTWLTREFDCLSPKLIVTFGAEACAVMTQRTLTEMRQQMVTYPEGTFFAGVRVICCVHPGGALRNTNLYKQFRRDADYLKAVVLNLGLANGSQKNYSA